ncbi:MAG: NAD-dependent malic enzyme [Candidatus Aenigmatarchaeota archaeon]|nr:MAG: NAD-dependent malic enzyme [Candidatus Aenigmarchaeota archaeon]
MQQEKTLDIFERSLEAHKKAKGKIAISPKMPVKTKDDLSISYTPGVAGPSKKIFKNPQSVYDYTSKGNLVAVVSDGSAVLGLGNIGPLAAMPVMEGKSILFKAFADVDALPICLDTQDPEEIIKTIKAIAPTFGGINLEDISAPRCFEIEKHLKKELDIPVFHDDQHGTAIVVLAALINASKITGKDISDMTVVISGAGAAGIAVARILVNYGAKDIVLCDTRGAIFEGREENMNSEKQEIAKTTNKNKKTGTIEDLLLGADVFIGVSKPETVTEEMIASMAKNAIVFAMANPIPEIMPDMAKKAGAKVVGTGRSDFPNQVNNVLAFPGIFRGALDVRASDINEDMKIAAARAIASRVDDASLREDNVLPPATDTEVATAVAKAVSLAAVKSNVSRIRI